MKEETKSKRIKGTTVRKKDRKCIVCGKKIRHYQWKELVFGKEWNICSNWWCSDKCEKEFKRAIKIACNEA